MSSPHNYFTLTKNPDRPTLPIGGGQVTYTYVVANTAGRRLYYEAARDDKCGTPRYSSGMVRDPYGYYYIPAGGTATFTCTQTVTATTTNNATFTFSGPMLAPSTTRSSRTAPRRAVRP